MDVGATRAIRQVKVGTSQTMLDRTEYRLGIKPDRRAADTAYGSSDKSGWLEKKCGIIPFIPVIDHSNRKDGAWTRFEFEYDEVNDQYIRPKDLGMK